ncbi:glycosyltransferase family 2 protein [Vibrio sp. Hal054]|uniref:glycosyltransferase family 2 protein n=1 Tax=Vibrio sp. Hal054 TaxID=3035158 RepID=UPI00301CDD3B
MGIKNVVDLGFENLILFDQDSAISEGFVGNLLNARNKAELSGLSIAAVGPVHIDVDTKEKSVISLTKDRKLVKLRPVSDSDDFTQSDFIIASGCLISVSALNVVGLMDSELFIDCVDIEWCYRAKSKDLVCIVALGEMMYHKVGDAPLSILSRNFTTHNPLRHYYYYRNFYILLRRPYISLAWKRYTFFKSSAQAIIFCCFLKPRIQHFKYIIKGIFHGIIGRKGKYE